MTLLALSLSAAVVSSSARALTLEDRVAAQVAIERTTRVVVFGDGKLGQVIEQGVTAKRFRVVDPAKAAAILIEASTAVVSQRLLTAGETLGYSPRAGDLRRKPEAEKQTAAMNMSIRGSAPTLAGTRTSPVLRDKFVPNAKVALDVDSAKFFDLLIGRLSSSPPA